MFWSALLLSIAALVADYAVWRRRIRCGRFAAYRKAYAAFVLTTDLLPGVVPVVLALCRDNGTAAMLFAQWCFFAFLITVVPRIVFYLFLALRMPRIGALLAAASVAVLLVGATRGRHAFRTEEVVIRSERLPAGFDGFRIVPYFDHLSIFQEAKRLYADSLTAAVAAASNAVASGLITEQQGKNIIANILE